MRAISNRAKYTVPNGTNVSFTVPFTIAYVAGNAEAPDGEGYFFFEQEATPDTLLVECKGTVSGSGTVFTMSDVLDTSTPPGSGTHTAATSTTVMTDSTQSFVADEFIGLTILNVTDGSSGVVTDNDTTTITVSSLTGGTDNDWDVSDVWRIVENQIPVFTTSAVNMRSNFGATLMNNVLGVGAKIYKGIIGQSNAVGVGWSTDYFPQLSEHPNLWSQFPMNLANQPDTVWGQESLVRGILTDKQTSGTNGQGVTGDRFMQSSLIHQQVINDPLFVKRPCYQTSGIIGGHCIEYIKREGNGERVVILPYGKGGASVLEWLKGGTLYTNFIAGVALGLSDGISILDTVDVHQGETDAMNAMSQGVWEGHWTDIIDDIRADLDALAIVHGFKQTDFSELRFIFGELAQDWVDAGKAAIDAGVNNMSSIKEFTEGVPSTGIPSDGNPNESSIHLSGDYTPHFGELYYLGERYAFFNDGVTNTIPSTITDFTIDAEGLTTFTPSFGFPKPTMDVEIALADPPFTVQAAGSNWEDIPPYTIELQLDISTLFDGVDYVARIKGVNGITADGAFSEDVPFTAFVEAYPTPTFDFTYPTSAGTRITTTPSDVTFWDSEVNNATWRSQGYLNQTGHIDWQSGVSLNRLVFSDTASATLDGGIWVGWDQPAGTDFRAGDLFTDELSILMRINVASFLGNPRALFSVSDNGTGGNYWVFWINDNVLTMFASTGGSTLSLDLSALGLLGKDIDVAFTYSTGGVATIYAGEGNLDNSDSESWSLPLPESPASNSGRMHIGSLRLISPSTAWPMIGDIADCTAWGTKLEKANLEAKITDYTAISA